MTFTATVRSSALLTHPLRDSVVANRQVQDLVL
jgi:hypothetical protein